MVCEVNLFNPTETLDINRSYTEARGNILDRNNVPLTANLRLGSVRGIPGKIDDKDVFVKKIKYIFPELNEDILTQRANNNSSFWIKRNISNKRLHIPTKYFSRKRTFL